MQSPQPRRRSFRFGWTASGLAIIAVHLGLLAWNAWRHSPVRGEACHLASGVSHLHLMGFDSFRVNPPLVRTLAAIPVVLSRPVVDFAGQKSRFRHERDEAAIASKFAADNGPKLLGLVFRARLACLLFSVVGASAVWYWAHTLYGRVSGLVALSLWCLSPYVLGHGAVIVPDAHAAAMGVAAMAAYWLWIRRGGLGRAATAGIALGLALLSKFTVLAFCPLVPLLWVMDRTTQPQPMRLGQWTREAGMLGVLLVTALCVLNAGYLFEGSFQPLGAYRFQSAAFGGAGSLKEVPHGGGNRFADAWLAGLPVPLPKNYVQGLQTQKLDFERGVISYLRGRWQQGGWWYFYLYALAVKVPLGTWTLAILALFLSTFRKGYSAPCMDEIVLLAPAVAVLVIACWQSGIGLHSRYMLPVLPFFFVWMSKVGRAAGSGSASWRTNRALVLSLRPNGEHG